MAASDTELIRRVVAGDRGEFRALLERHQDSVYRFIHNLVGHRHSAEDITQETLLAAYQNLHAFDERRAKFSTWLFTIARNRAINHLARSSRLKWTALSSDAFASAQTTNSSPDHDLRETLDRALDRLPPRQKTVFVLAEIEQLTHKEIAAIEGVSPGTVKSRLHRAKQRLRQSLQAFSEKFKCL